MKIYVLLVEKYEGSETICVSENIEQIKKFREKFNLGTCAELEIWENEDCIFDTSGTDVIKKIESEMKLQ